MEFILGWIVFSIIPAVIASGKGRNAAGWFFTSLVISPLFAGILVACLPAIKGEEEKEREEKEQLSRAPCPQCAESVLKQAKLCPHCRSVLEPGWSTKDEHIGRPAEEPMMAESDGPSYSCPECRVPVSSGRPICPKCGKRVRVSRPA